MFHADERRAVIELEKNRIPAAEREIELHFAPPIFVSVAGVSLPVSGSSTSMPGMELTKLSLISCAIAGRAGRVGQAVDDHHVNLAGISGSFKTVVQRREP